MMNTNELIKCKYYNTGYCRNKDKCSYYHPRSDCKDHCKNKECKLRHRVLCRYGQYCYHYIRGQCEYVHLNKYLFDEPMVIEDNQTIETHKVILAAPSPVFKDQNEKIQNLEKSIVNIKKK